MRLVLILMSLYLFSINQSIAQINNETELRKQADKDFDNGDFYLSYKIYSQLVSLNPKDPDYNFRLGVCMLFIEPDKKRPFSYFNAANADPKLATKETKFYLGKTFQVNYKFDEAIKLFNEYKQIASPSSIKKLQVDREIEACKNGKKLLTNLMDLYVIAKKQLNEADYFRSYDLKDVGGKLLVKPDDFRSSIDKKKKEKSVVYLPRNGERVYFSSYGETPDKGRDIYFVNKLSDGKWSKPIAMPFNVNTEYDEDYPYLHPNGKTLYFSSKGHNSMGGYDIFKTTFEAETQTWSKPINLEFPINSPDDDFLFVTDSLEKQAFFSTGRYSPYGKIDVLKINTERRPMDLAIIKGSVVKTDPTQIVNSKITVKNVDNGETVGVFQAKDNGDYSLEIPNGGKFIFTVETTGFTTQSEGVQIPSATSLKLFRQYISYENKKLVIKNNFEGLVIDENYSEMLDLIEKKAKLEVNENEPINNELINQTKTEDNANSKSNTTKPTIVQEVNNLNQTTGDKNVTNEKLLAMSKMDAVEAEIEAKKLKQEATEAFDLATQKTAEAAELDKKAEYELAAANLLTDKVKKNLAVENVNKLKNEAKLATSIASSATNLAKRLEADAVRKQNESNLTNQYVNELGAIIKNKNNKEAVQKLEKIQKELDVFSKQKNQSDESFEIFKAEMNLKQNELTKSETKSKAILKDISNIENEYKILETDLANEKDKSLKENISAQMSVLKNDIESRNKELEINNSKINKLKNEIESISTEINVASKILNEQPNKLIASNQLKPIKSNDVSNSNQANTKTSGINNINQSKTATGSNTKQSTTNNSNVNNNNKSINNEKAIASSTLAVGPRSEIKTSVKLLEQAELNSNKAFDLRKNAKTKTGAEKENLIKQAIENEKIALDKKLEAATLADKENQDSFKKNLSVIADLEKATTGINNEDIVKAKTLSNEAQLIFNQAEQLRVEANKNSSVSAKLGGLNNAEEKEAEAIAKQEKSLELLLKQNPNKQSETKPIVNLNEKNTEVTNASKIEEPSVKLKTNDVEIVKPNLNNLEIKLIESPTVFSNSDAQNLKNKAFEKFDLAKNFDKELENQSNKNIDVTTKNSITATDFEKEIDDMISEAERLNTESFKFRKLANSKTGDEKNKDLTTAQRLEAEAVSKKINAANKKKKLNSAIFEANQKSLEDLKQMAIGKNISELNSAETVVTEANLLYNKAKALRKETDTYATDVTKLGGYGNAEEKEGLALNKQLELLTVYKKYFSNYEVKKPIINDDDSLAVSNKNIDDNNRLQIEGLNLLSQAIEIEYASSLASLPNSMSPSQNTLKGKAQIAFEKFKDLKSKSNQKNINSEKKDILTDAVNNGQKAIEFLNQIKDNKEVVLAENNKTPTLKNSVVNVEKNNDEASKTTTLNLNPINENSNVKKNNIEIKNSSTKTTDENNNISNKNSNNNPVSKNNLTASNNASVTSNSTLIEDPKVSTDNNSSQKDNAAQVKIAANKKESTVNNNRIKLKVEGLEITKTNAYSDSKPIPIDKKIEDGLVFKVQIGAFKQALPNSVFKGLAPIIAQSNPNGYLRYMAGNFEKYESANAVKNDLKNLGYTDAFVVAYFNGVRINLNEALEKAKLLGQSVANNINATAGLTEKNNIPKNEFANPNKETPNLKSIEVTKELEKINGLLYTIQIGVYSSEVTNVQLNNLKPIFSEKLQNGLYRYTAGIYNQAEKLLEDKQKIINLGVKDAFVSAYYNSKRLSFVEGKNLQTQNKNIKIEAQSPIIFPSELNFESSQTNANANEVKSKVGGTVISSGSAFTNGVTSSPIPTADNGVKIDDKGISFKVQIGAYKNEIPDDIAAKFLNIKSWPVKNIIINDLFIYTIGNFSELQYAKKLRDEAYSIGITDAYITVYKDGKKLYGAEVTKYLSK